MTTSSEQIRAFTGPAILSYGFRPFFLFGSVWAALAVALWLPMLAGEISLPTAFGPLEWHIHELLYGFVPAVIAGFLLTAVPNWTGRLPVVGRRLLMLFLLWVAGRVAILGSAIVGATPAALVDLAFLATLEFVMAREILAADNTRNLKVLVVVSLLAIGNLLFHLEAIAGIGAGHGTRLGIAAVVLLISIIGGRIIPSFTHNWLVKHGADRLPVPFGKFDMAVIAATPLALAAWVVTPESVATAVLAAAVGVLQIARLARWAGPRTMGEPLVLILHVAYGFVPLGFLLLALGNFRPDIIAPAGAVHGWTAGAIGMMTLAVMTRASLGHTGHALTASRSVQIVYLAAFVAAVTRIAAAFHGPRDALLTVSALAWVLAFGGFAVLYAPLLTRPGR